MTMTASWLGDVGATRSAGAARRADPGGRYLGPGRVVETGASHATVQLEGGRIARAELALAFPYEPRADDVLLCIGQDGGFYVIGVIHGRGRSTLAFQGDVSLRAVDGTLDLAGDRGVTLRGPEVDVLADKLKVVARAMTEKLGSLCQSVRDLLSVRAGESRMVVRGAWHAQSKRAALLTEETIAINGKQVHLG